MNKSLSIQALTTPLFSSQQNIIDFIVTHVPADEWEEGTILAITSKIVSLAENRIVSRAHNDKKNLIQAEAEYNLGEIGHGVSLTIKQGLLLPAAGIDESNSENGDYILHPQDPFASASEICKTLKKRLNLTCLGVILTDSRTGPLRRGVLGVSLAFAGIKPLKNMIGEKDLFGRPLKMTTVNVVDSVAAAAVLLMGEAAEQRPLALIKNAPIEFTEERQERDLIVPIEEDLYAPLYRHLIK